MAVFRFPIFALTVAAHLVGDPAYALTGKSELHGPMAAHAVMVLTSAMGRSGFCTGVVIAPEVLLTAAHCVATPKQTRVYFKEADSPVLLEAADIAIHAGYKPDAPRTRERSIDLALIRIAGKFPPRLDPLTLHGGAGVKQGELVGISGFGVTQEGAGQSAGELRWGRLKVRAPLSTILLWAEDPGANDFGACQGDSGGPIFDLATKRLIAITSWSEGSGRRHCGSLTQAALIAPQIAWIDGVLRGWGVKR